MSARIEGVSIVLAAALTASCAMADDPIVFQGTATGENAAPATDVSDASKWGGAAPGPDHDYLVTDGKYCGFGGAGTFGGRSIILGDNTTSKAGFLDGSKVTGSWTYDFGTVVMNCGGFYSRATGGMMTIGGDITVNGTSASPVYIKNFGGNNAQMTFSGAFHGSGFLRVFKPYQNNDQLTIRFTGDMSDFTGTMYVGESAARTAYVSSIGYRTPVLVGDTTMGCNVSLYPCGAIGACGTGTPYYGCFSVPNLTFAAGSAIRFAVNDTTGGTIRVTNTLTLPASGQVCLDVRDLPNDNPTVRRHPILIAPSGTGISTNSFRIYPSFGNGDPTPNVVCKVFACSLEAGTDSDGSEVLYLVMDKYVHLVTADDWNHSSWLPGNSAHWSGVAAGTPLDPDMNYLSWDKAVVTPQMDDIFGGKRLVLASPAGNLTFAVPNITIDDFVMANNVYAKMTMYHSTLRGTLTLFDPNGRGTGGRLYTANEASAAIIASTLKGDGVLTLQGIYTLSETKDGRGVFVLSSTNTEFRGKIAVLNNQNHPATNTTLRISDARALGGPRTAFAYDALSFSNWSRLQADASLVLAEPTRGVYFAGGNYVSVPDATNTLTLASQTTLAGTLVKQGAGTLALGGTLKFTSTQSATPLAGTNVLQVAAGRIRPASKGGADGLAISFAAGTGLKFAPISETDADVVQYGLYDVKWTTPFDLTETDGKLDVALELPENKREIPSKFSFGVCTVPAAAAEALDGNVVLPKILGYKSSVTGKANGDGSVTFTAAYEKVGFILIFE
ncbi:MAG: hypothetical protein IJG84_03755 [Kiritimatiellae bacterium]|nr:hypothetical protein [Kiritimatiellia bacterium]